MVVLQVIYAASLPEEPKPDHKILKYRKRTFTLPSDDKSGHHHKVVLEYTDKISNDKSGEPLYGTAFHHIVIKDNKGVEISGTSVPIEHATNPKNGKETHKEVLKHEGAHSNSKLKVVIDTTRNRKR
ncbi:hypothetical protein Ddc_07343 [Ditylenchus destructor]|nr:hypothetical protein Ddc_07343 [Ditylenchus destructor]